MWWQVGGGGGVSVVVCKIRINTGGNARHEEQEHRGGEKPHRLFKMMPEDPN